MPGTLDPAEMAGLDVSLQFETMRGRLVDRILLAGGIFALVYLPVLIWRASEAGWQLHLQVHAWLVAFTLPLMALRKRMSVRFKAGVIVAIFLGVGLIGVFTLGMVGGGAWWAMQGAFIAGTLYSTRAGIVVGVVCLSLMAVAGLGFSMGWLVAPYDLDLYNRTPSAWVIFLAVLGSAQLLMLHALGQYQSMIRKVAAEVSGQRDELLQVVGHDQLTDLPQASVAADRLESALAHARRTGRKVALLFVDLDGFKGVNDTHGHAAGDEVLRRVASRMQAAVREQDTVARVGGDEFIVILTGLVDSAAAIRVADQIIAKVAEPFVWQSQTLSVGASIGIALYPDQAKDGDSLRRLADAAMYQAKHGGRNGWRHSEATAL